MQKSRFNLVAYGLLAVAVFLIVLVACGEGIVEPPKEEWRAEDDVTGASGIIKRCSEDWSKDGCYQFISNSSRTSSSSKDGASSDSEGEGSSSSEEEGENSSSSDEEEESSSSSEEEPSSSSTGPTQTLTCTGVAADGTKGTAVPRPTVKCGDNTISSSNATFTWRTGNCLSGDVKPDNFSGASAGEFFISVKADCGGENQEKCCGDIIISDGKSSSSARSSSSAAVLYCDLPAIGIVGESINVTVTCNGTTISSSNLTWSSGAPNWTSPKAGTYSDITVTAKSGSCSGKTEGCGSIEVKSSNSSGGGSSSGSGGGDCSKSGWCDYGGGECYQMPTDDCCKDGELVASQSACRTASSTEYCNYGECKGGSGWDCNDGGGCYTKKSSDNCNGGSVVKTCPKGTCPPSANYCAK